MLGSGGMAKAVTAALRDAGFTDGVVVARNDRTGPALAEQYGFRWTADLGSDRPQVLVNATPVGMAGGPDESALPVAEGRGRRRAGRVRRGGAAGRDAADPAGAGTGRRRASPAPRSSPCRPRASSSCYTGVRPSDALVRWASERSRE